MHPHTQLGPSYYTDYSDYHHYRQLISFTYTLNHIRFSCFDTAKQIPLTRTFQNCFPASPTTRFSLLRQIDSSSSDIGRDTLMQHFYTNYIA